MTESPVSFRVAKDDLDGAVSWVARYLPAKPTQPVLRAMVLTADDEGLQLSGYDYDISTKVRIAAEVAEAGTFAVSGKLFSSIVGVLPDKPVDVNLDDSQIRISCGSSIFELPTIPLDEYPQLPQFPDDTGIIPENEFAEAVRQVGSAAGDDETLPMLTGIYVEIDGPKILMAATDRFRMAVRTLEWDTAETGQAKILIPARKLTEVANTIGDGSGDDVHLSVGSGENMGTDRLFGVRSGQKITTTRLLDSEFPNFRPLLPKQHTSIATVETKPLLDALRRVTQVQESNNHRQVRLEFSDGQVVISASGAELGDAEETLPCSFIGEPLMTAFNAKYLKDGLSAVTTPRAVFGFTEASRPAVLLPQPDELPEADDEGVFPAIETEFTYLLMPVRLPG